ncbi:MAG: laccase domain-containing protein [Candidatus Levybacteria bacterium]|nr:laccase domain-containing protein [Candidatus Levybacteria bacterium]
MAEVKQVSDNIEAKITARKERITQEVDKIDTLFEVEHLPGFEDRVGYFPILDNLAGRPVLARFSYGKNAPNMSAKFFDNNKGESEVTNERNRREFLEQLGFPNYPFVLQTVGAFEGAEPQIEEVNVDTLKDKTKVVGNIVFTRDPELTLDIIPADCPTGVLYCKDSQGNPIAAILHGGADALNAGMIRQGLWVLRDEYGVDLSQAVLGIAPGVLAKNYFITNEPERRGNGIIERNWGDYITEKTTDDPSEKRYVDLTSAFVMQALEAGLNTDNIQTYGGVDTYQDASDEKAYSRRYYNEHDKKRPGGQILAVRLNPDAVNKSSGLYSLPQAA